MKKLLLLLTAALVVANCAPRNAPPELKPLYTAESVLIRVHELQNTADALNLKGQLSNAHTKLIVTFTRETAVVLKDAKVGWQELVKSSWETLKKQVNGAGTGIPANLQTLFNVMDAMVGTI